MKKLTVMFLILSLLLCGCGATAQAPEADTLETLREFTDSTGRTVSLPEQIETIAISGPLSQIYILPLAGDMLVGVSNAYTEDAAPYLPSYIWEKTEIGQLYGGKGEMDLEALLAADPDVVIDIGEPKKTTADDLTALTEQTGIPFIHIDATVATAPDAYRTLGKLLNREDKAAELAVWCEKTYAMMTAMMERVDAANARKSLLYCLGDKGVNVIAEGSFHAETINMMGKNLAVLEEVVSSGAGNEVDLEQILVWNPEVIIFAPDSCYEDIALSPQWQSVGAVAQGNFYKTPTGPYGWLSSPPAVQRYLGMLWLGQLLYPEYTEYDLQKEVIAYYKLFYDCDLMDEMYRNLISDALPKS
ncbi:MAG: ABC transporter substrate-binding protein [Oscillospiraceae bacterium]|nr:ABC transporter substrate-binding protein [Oscillospiraceae bacterium]